MNKIMLRSYDFALFAMKYQKIALLSLYKFRVQISGYLGFIFGNYLINFFIAQGNIALMMIFFPITIGVGVLSSLGVLIVEDAIKGFLNIYSKVKDDWIEHVELQDQKREIARITQNQKERVGGSPSIAEFQKEEE